ncbi:helix-turn-helix domain-containing protein [Bacillus thuringiensis]|uniref:helix-turn-helix domain-containing protein n=1 Tax=Bacillus thuringiensis TaxID=1428 RepID=UPI000CF9FB0C|nr:helix-turn-helix domain-containing protein [Bacillus thuringiensis]PQQ47539.1 hypothetical protein C6A34_12090 [Bacillus thuringiensis]
MEKLIEYLIQDKSLLRKIKILEMLVYSDEIQSTSILSENLKCTSRTIINDISQLKSIIPENWELISVPSKGYLLKRGYSENLSSIIAPYMLNSDLYKILLGIFNQKYYSLEKWSQLLHLDKLTLKKYLKNFQKILDQFSLKFEFKIVRIVGKEHNIRNFYIMFFFNIQKYKRIYTLDFKLLKNIEYITKLYDIELDYNLLTISINVLIKRIINKQFIIKQINYTPSLNTSISKSLKFIISELEYQFNINIPKVEVESFGNALFLMIEGGSEETVNIRNYYFKTNRELYDRICNLFKTISMKINVNNKIKEKIKYEMFYRFHKISIIKDNNLTLEGFMNGFTTINQEFIEGYDIMFPLIIDWNKNINKNRFTKDEIHYILFHILIVIHSNYTKKGLLQLSGDSSLKKFIYYKLKYELGDIATLQQKPEYGNKFDFIIANYQIQNAQIPVFHISSELIQEDLKYIRQFLSPYSSL